MAVDARKTWMGKTGSDRINLRQLRYFATIVREGNIGRASRILNVAQPALTRQIQKLEAELGIPLLVRHHRGVAPTPAGRQLAVRAEGILQEVDEILREFKAAREPSGTLTVCLSPSYADLFTVPLTTLLARRHPNLRLRFITAALQARLEMVVQGHVDIALAGWIPPMPRLTYVPLGEDPVCLVFHPDDKRFDEKGVELEQLDGLSLVVVSNAASGGIRKVLDDAREAHGLKLGMPLEVDSVKTAKSLVKAGLGVTVCTESLARPEIDHGELRCAPIIGLVWPRVLAIGNEQADSTEISVIVDLFRECLNTWRTSKIVHPWSSRRSLPHVPLG